MNARIRKAWSRGANIGLIGETVDLTYEYTHMGNGRADLKSLLKQKFTDVLTMPSLVIVGQAALQGEDGESVLGAVMELCTKTESKLLVLHSAASRVGLMDLGCTTEGGVDAAVTGCRCGL